MLLDCWISGYSLYATPNMLKSSGAWLKKPRANSSAAGSRLSTHKSQWHLWLVIMCIYTAGSMERGGSFMNCNLLEESGTQKGLWTIWFSKSPSSVWVWALSLASYDLGQVMSPLWAPISPIWRVKGLDSSVSEIILRFCYLCQHLNTSLELSKMQNPDKPQLETVVSFAERI